jgi:DNA polymerase III delta subunit
VKYPNSKKLMADLSKKDLRRMYLFMGEEEGEKDKCISAISSILFGKEGDSGNYTGRFHCENDEIMQAADFALSGSMFSTSRLCVMYNIDGIKGLKENRSIIADIAANLAEGTVLVMTTAKNRPPDLIPSELLGGFEIIQFWRHFDSDISNYITMNMRKAGHSIADRALNLLIERTGKDIRKIDEALELIRYSGSAGIVTEELIRDIVNDEGELSVYDFIDMLFRRDRRAPGYCRKLMDDGIAEGRIFFEITRQIEQLEKYHALIDDSASPLEAMDKCGVQKRNQEKFAAYARSFGRESIGGLYRALVWADSRRKSGSQEYGVTGIPVFSLVSRMVLNDI